MIKGDLQVSLDAPVVGGFARMAISSDGKTLAYVGTSSDEKTDLYVRQLDQWTSQKLDGTEGAQQPFFSSDNKWIGFVAGGKLKKNPGQRGNLCNSLRPTKHTTRCELGARQYDYLFRFSLWWS